MYISDAYTKVAELVHRGKSSLITTPTTTFLDQQAFGRTFIGPNATLPKGKEKKKLKKTFLCEARYKGKRDIQFTIYTNRNLVAMLGDLHLLITDGGGGNSC